MAQPYKPELFSIDSVLDFYQNADGVHYKIYGGTSPKPEYCRYHFEGDEKEIGLQKLDEALHGLKSNLKNTNPYLIQIFKSKSKDRRKVAVKTTDIENQYSTQIVFQLNEPERYLPYNGLGMVPQQSDPEMKMVLAKLVEGQNLLISKLSAEEIEDDEPAPQQQNFIGAILNNEKFQEMAIAAISGLLTSKFLSSNQPTALAGVPMANEDQISKANYAVDLLSKKDPLFGDHLLYLANLDDSKFNLLLSFIK